MNKYEKNFEKFMKALKNTSFELKDYVDFEKIAINVDKVKDELSILNNYIGKTQLDFYNLFIEKPELKVIIPSLIALRNKKVYTKSKEYVFSENMSNEDLFKAIQEIEFFKLLEFKKITNVTDYLTGIEVGMDTNARKNRSGTLMEKRCEDILKAKKVKFHKQIDVKKLEEKIPNFNFNEIQQAFSGKNAPKRFDFMFEFNNKYYLTEVNFFSNGGSKLNETAKSYILLNEIISKYDNIEFVWITDGAGWNTAKNQIRDAYFKINYLFNLEEFENNSLEFLLD
ncbi:type II restriction enzyme [Spiroplasma helicoides]|uniref:Type-2 restriction enzyme n=1 Tax=Spiroplasma helicoides TaxID=216938 RepID=A0A1B3SKE3_9MOLU|nr:DpnII family type II restriction endonuclease [Spiroplasma helicoides]AOG60386.1 type II restriction enzyme [Spiroplasma helicoides]